MSISSNFGPLYSQDTCTYLSLMSAISFIRTRIAPPPRVSYMHVGFFGNAIPKQSPLCLWLVDPTQTQAQAQVISGKALITHQAVTHPHFVK